MQKEIQVRLTPSESAHGPSLLKAISQITGEAEASITGYQILKKSIDARSRQQIWVNLSLIAFIKEPISKRFIEPLLFPSLPSHAKEVIIIGAGPAGLFAALECIQLGLRPIIIERGKDVRARRRDLASLNKEGIVNPESNYCFGEGGAGTYSDGKLYTRSNKRGSIDKILKIFYQFGADENILYEAHPHIGTNKLPHIITAMREQIEASGGKVLFEKKLVDFVIENNNIQEIITADGDRMKAAAYILATGHSARDIFTLLFEKNISIEAKPFALGVRVEHPQSAIDAIQYHCLVRDPNLPPASYSLVEQVSERGVFSFCMCPGGIIAPAATAPGEIVVNGWSPSKRDNPYANSGMVVQIDVPTAANYLKKNKNSLPENHPLLLLAFQKEVEQAAFKVGGGLQVAPAARLIDFCSNKVSANLPDASYLPGLISAPLNEVLPSFVHRTLQEGFKAFGKKMKGYYTNDAVVVATESRTSSPVRIPREADTLHHPQIKNLYPCAEGAGYAGGIVSAAMDGQKLAQQIASIL
ncbi:MAG: NAD(P)/FAD-dependent oxidoreductase [Sediminibacterium sp.]|nr:NAD(P)/FAD-dependent oxidoreductase [Sediminibacterium sp.]